MRINAVVPVLFLTACTDAGTAASREDAGAPRDGSSSDRKSLVPDASFGPFDASSDEPLDGSALFTREVPGFPNRAYIVHLPHGSLPETTLPVVLVLHGGGGNAQGTRRLTCPGGVLVSPRCLEAVGDREGFAVVYPNGTSGTPATSRTWNAGGGANCFQCVSGLACAENIDDTGYFNALLDDLATALPIDDHRIFATGISNGAAMCHRLACELSDRIAAIAPVAGGNQFSTAATCSPKRPVYDFEIHGTDDPCWGYAGGPAACLQVDGLNKISVAQTILDWVGRDGCNPTPSTSSLPDVDPNDGTTTQAVRYAPCNAGSEVSHLEIVGGGHTWPGGFLYLPVATVGRVSRDFDANVAIWNFFKLHAMP